MTRVFWINLDRRTDRREHMEREFAARGLAGTRVSATTPDTIPAELAARHADPSAPIHISPPELATVISHRRAWEAFLATAAPHALFLEDDACLAGSIGAFLATAPADLGGFDIIRIETRLTLRKIGPENLGGWGGVRLHAPLSYEFGGTAYMLTRPAALKLTRLPSLYDAPVDDTLFDLVRPDHHGLRMAQTVPALCLPGDRGDLAAAVGVFRSDAEEARSNRFSRPTSRKPTWQEKIPREIRRIFRQVAGGPRWLLLLARRGVGWRAYSQALSEGGDDAWTIVPYADDPPAAPPSTTPPPSGSNR